MRVRLLRIVYVNSAIFIYEFYILTLYEMWKFGSTFYCNAGFMVKPIVKISWQHFKKKVK